MPRKLTEMDYVKYMGLPGTLIIFAVVICFGVVPYLTGIIAIENVVFAAGGSITVFMLLLGWNMWKYAGTWTLTKFEVKMMENWIRRKLGKGDVVSAKEVEKYIISEIIEKSNLTKQDRLKMKNNLTKFKYAEKFLISMVSRRYDFARRFCLFVPRKLSGARIKKLSDGGKAIYYPKRALK